MAPSPVSIDMIRRLVAFDTTSRNSNLELIDFVRDYLDGFGIASRLVHDDTGTKANLYATLGPEDVGGIALSGHTDVVPVDGQHWSSDPWTVAERDGRLYGRGTCDMKGFLAVALALVPEFLSRGLKTPVHLVLSHDEEVGCIGIRSLIDVLSAMPVRPRACIVGEPTEMKVMVAHKGKMSMRCHVHGHECHSSLAPAGVNAIEYAAEVIAYLRAMARRKAEQGPFDPAYDVPHTTIHTGVVHGGTALNIVPKDCYFDFEIRHIAEDDPAALIGEVQRFAEETLKPQMTATAPGAGFTWKELSRIPGLATREDEEIVALAKALSGSNSTGKVAFATEAGLFQEVGIPTIICGPGSIEQAHKPDEFVSLDQIAQCVAFMRRLMDRVCISS